MALLDEAVSDFAHQSFPDRELLILHDGSNEIHAALLDFPRRYPDAAIRLHQAPSGHSLGQLRNISLDLAQGDWICQWDDDDRYHPDRLALQWAQLCAEGAQACFLVDQLHWLRREGLIFWTDWDREPYPMNVVQGTLLALRDILPRYPDLPRGEDTGLTHALMRAAARGEIKIARLKDAGWCTIYTHHGTNVWGQDHHAAIIAAKHLGPARLLPRLHRLRAELARYRPALPTLRTMLGGALQSL